MSCSRIIRYFEQALSWLSCKHAECGCKHELEQNLLLALQLLSWQPGGPGFYEP
jgi:hypothetical protein